MTTTEEGPAAVNVARVPRSRMDDLYIKGDPLPVVRIGSATVISVEGDTCTVLLFDEEIPGVVWLGRVPPAIGAIVELESRGDLLVIPESETLDTFIEGMADDAEHIVSDTEPGNPDPETVNVGGSMRDPTLWVFATAANGWRTELWETGVGVRAWQAVGTLQARNACPNPSFETGLGSWQSNSIFGTWAVATPTWVNDRYLFGTHSANIVWPNKGTTNGSNYLHPPVPMDPATKWILSVHVFIPEGSPDVKPSLPFITSGTPVTQREQWVWAEVEFQPPASGAGDWFGIATSNPVAGTQCWLDAIVVRPVGQPMPPELTYFDGSLPDTATLTFEWEGTAHASASVWYDGQIGVPGTATLWSTEGFDVAPGDLLDVTVVASKNAGVDATMQLAVVYNSNPDADPNPATDQIVTYGSPVTVNAANVTLTQAVTVLPALSDGTLPTGARVGIILSGAGSADLILNSVAVTRTVSSWPLGSLWLNPAAGNALPTIGTTEQTSNTAVTLPWHGAGQFGRMPSGFKALVTAPSDTDGFVLAFYNATISTLASQTAATGILVGVLTTGAVSSGGGQARFASPTASPSNQQPVAIAAWARVAAGTTVELYPAYQYGSDPGSANLLQVRATCLTVVFIPTGVTAGDPGQPAPVSYWDGDSWRPGSLAPALMDLTKTATTAEPGKTATTTTLARSASDVHAGTNVTLTATVTPTAADGTVTFYRATASGGPWTSLGSVTLDGSNKAAKTLSSAASATYYYRATYGGSATHAASTSASTTVRYRTKTTRTITLNASWVQAYNGDGAKVSTGTGFDGAVHQGTATSGSGNRRSLIKFPQPSFTGSEVDVTDVVLKCTDWHQWMAGDNRGTLVVGWHENTGTEPGSYPGSKTHNDRSRFARGEGSFTCNVTSWADVIVGRSDFGGITVGPGGNSSAEFYGWSENGANKWDLTVTYSSWS